MSDSVIVDLIDLAEQKLDSTVNVQIQAAALVTLGLAEVARAMGDVAYQLKQLGNADASTHMGAIEGLGLVIKEGIEKLSDRQDTSSTDCAVEHLGKDIKEGLETVAEAFPD
jgi:hypothetical protein